VTAGIRHLTLLLLLAALMGGLAFLARPSPATSACAAAPSADCLADLAVQAGLKDRSPPAYIRDLAVLPMMGRFDQAQALLDHMRKAQEAAGSTAPDYDGLAAHRIAAFVRGGMTAEQALAQVPTAQYGALWIAGSTFWAATLWPRGTPAAGPRYRNPRRRGRPGRCPCRQGIRPQPA
jgi:hypothetical protein